MEDAEARRILRDHGEEPPVRGKLNPDWIARATHFADQDGGEAGDSGSDPDLDEPTIAADPVPDPVPAERRPRRVAGPARQSLRDRLASAAKGKTGTKKKTTHKRLSLAPVIGEFWGLMGSLAGRVDVPLGRCLQMQSPVAGEILEDVVRGTIVDTALQPIARAEDKAKTVGALVLPPLVVVAIEHAQALPEDQRQMREAFLLPILAQSLIMWERVAGEKVEQMAARVEADAGALERAQHTIELIFPQVPAAPVPQPETVGV